MSIFYRLLFLCCAFAQLSLWASTQSPTAAQIALVDKEALTLIDQFKKDLNSPKDLKEKQSYQQLEATVKKLTDSFEAELKNFDSKDQTKQINAKPQAALEKFVQTLKPIVAHLKTIIDQANTELLDETTVLIQEHNNQIINPAATVSQPKNQTSLKLNTVDIIKNLKPLYEKYDALLDDADAKYARFMINKNLLGSKQQIVSTR